LRYFLREAEFGMGCKRHAHVVQTLGCFRKGQNILLCMGRYRASRSFFRRLSRSFIFARVLIFVSRLSTAGSYPSRGALFLLGF
jgi:hypothetical protein